MATYWASKPSLPFASAEEKSTVEYQSLIELSEAVKGLTIAQGAPDIFGAFEMMCALHYHFLNFERIVSKKCTQELPSDAPDERYEAVAYVSRIGQLYYFLQSEFIKRAAGEDFPGLTWIDHLVPFRHKYSAHRDRDKPKKNEENSLDGELSLGALGGHLFVEKYPGSLSEVHAADPIDRNLSGARQYQCSYVAYQMFGVGNTKYFVLQRDHAHLFSELSEFMRWLIGVAKAMPRE
jgi:hypothetical protein